MHRAEDVLNAVSETVAFRQSREEHEWISELEKRTDHLREAMELQNKNLNTICTFHHCYNEVHFVYLSFVLQLVFNQSKSEVIHQGWREEGWWKIEIRVGMKGSWD